MGSCSSTNSGTTPAGSRPSPGAPNRGGNRRRGNPPLETPPMLVTITDDDAGDEDTAGETGDESATEKPPKSKAKVQSVDLNKTENRAAHHGTGEYKVPNLVLRRGQSFTITVELNREYSPKFDKINVVIATGNQPLISKGTIIKLPIEEKLSPKDWGATVKSADGKNVTFEIMIAPDAIAGRHTLYIETYLKDHTKLNRMKHDEDIYILFNAWCEDDSVYLGSELERDEYVMNETGIIWRSHGGKKWVFAQFEADCFLAANYLLEISYLAKEYHGNVVRVCRALSALVNSSDDNGVLSGNWSGDYHGGISPLAWNGSEDILEEFMRTKKDVKYGQCWVFSGVLTTVCRALGIPTRSVTNFSSAHDNDGNCIIDWYLDYQGERMRHTGDSVWNFHVWNEAWMKRPDLPDGNDGWQAFDSTPQESSDDRMQCGPAPLAALKRGDIHLPHDSKFIFAEVNGDVVKWQYDDSYNRHIVDIFTRYVGQDISTKSVGSDQLEIITDSYKHKEGSEEAKNSMIAAMSHGDVARARLKMIEEFKGIERVQDVTFEFKQEVETSGNVTYSIEVENTSSETRTAKVHTHIVATYYTGEDGEDLSRKDFIFNLNPTEKKNESWTIEAKDWMNTVAEDANMAAYFMGRVDETDQKKHVRLETKLDKPDIEMTALPAIVKVGAEVDINIEFENPLNIPLTRIILKIGGAGIKPQTIKIKEQLAPGEKLQKSVKVSPQRTGKGREVVASLNCRQLTGITGAVQIEVTEE